MWPNLQKTVDLVTFTEEILNRKLHFLCSEILVDLLENMHASQDESAEYESDIGI